VQPIYDEIVSKIRNDAQVPGRWVASSGAPPPPMGGMGGMGGSQNGQNASLDATGMAGVCSSNNLMEVESFIRRVVESLQGRVAEQRGLQQFASTWLYRIRQYNCEASRITPVYDEMIAKIRADASTPGSWVAAGAAGPSGAAAPESGQTASLSAAGLAGVVACGNPAEVEAFISRVVTSVGARVVDNRKLAEYASNWTLMTKQQNCEASKCQLIYDDLVSKIRRDVTKLGGWLVQSGQSSMGAPPQSGQTAPLNAAGFAGAAATNNPADVETFLSRLVASLQGRVLEHRGLTQFASTWTAKAKEQNCEIERVRLLYDDMTAKLHSEAQMMGAWLTMPRQAMSVGASPQSGQTAPLDANGLAGSVSSTNPIDVETFINRVITSLGCSIVDQRGFTQFVSTWSSATRSQNCDPMRVRTIYQDMTNKIRNDAQTYGGWVKQSGPSQSPLGGMSASPQSGQTAQLNAAGLAGVVASNNIAEVETFIGRVVTSLGCRVVDQRKLQEYAQRWSQMTRDQNCEASKLSNIYQDLQSRISADAQQPGGWVAMQYGGAAPSQPMGVRASPMSGQTATLDEKGLAGVCATNKAQDVEMFIGRLAVFLGFHVQEYPSLKQHAATWADKVRSFNCEAARLRPVYEEIENKLRTDAKIPGGWVKDPKAPAKPVLSGLGMGGQPQPPPLAPGGGSAYGGGGGGTRALPKSGQSATLDAPGFAATVAFAEANSKPTDVEAFVGRLVYSLGLRISSTQYATMRQLAAEWASQVKAQNCVVERISTIYNDIVARIRRDSQTPGAWVSGSATPTSSPSPAPAAPAFSPLGGGGSAMRPLGSPAPPMGSAYAPMGSPPPLAPMGGAPPLAPMGGGPPLAPLGSFHR